MVVRIKRMTSDWQIGEQNPLFTLAPNVVNPLAFQSPVLHVILHAQLWQVCQVDVMTGGVDTAASTDLVALVNAVDELGVRGCPRKTDSCWVDRLGLHVAWSYGGHWDGWGEEEKVRQSGRKNKRRTEGKKQGCDNAFQFAVGSLPASV